MTTPELLQFPYSNFNEKARWAFDWKGVAHRRTNLLPGPHISRVRRIAPETTVPVLVFEDGEVVQGSARIIAALEARCPEPSLYPSDPAQREEALAIERRFDEEFGPAVRKALFSQMLHDGEYVTRVFAGCHPLPTRLLYRGMFPVVKGKIRAMYRLHDEASVDAAFATVEAGLDLVAERAGPGGRLVGDSFSVADLAAAALLAPVCSPAHPDMARVEPFPELVARWNERWAAHPGVEWVLATYRDHRPKASSAGA